MPERRKFPFRPKDGGVIWTISDGEEIEMSWNEFVKMVQSEEWVALPRKEFEEYYKRMRMPIAVREYHANAKRKSGSSNRR